MDEDRFEAYPCHRCNHPKFMHRKGACDGIDEWEEAEENSACPCEEYIDHKG